MANIHHQLLEKFNFQQADEWQKCIYEQFCIASDLGAPGKQCQVNALLYCLGKNVEDVLHSNSTLDDNWKQYNMVLEKLDQFF